MDASGRERQAVGHPIDVASGVLFHELADYVVPGRMPLIWSRRYSSGLLGKATVGMFGPCWSSPYEMHLRRDLDGYTMVAADGENEISFDDPGNVVVSSGVIRNLGACHELRAEGDELIVTKWNPEEHEVEHLRFEPTTVADFYRLRSKEFSDGHAIDVTYDKQGRIARLRQRREGRSFILTYDSRGQVSKLHVAGQASGPEGQRPNSSRLIWTYRYDEAGRLCEAVDALAQRCAYDYDQAGRMIREVLLGGMVYHFRYDPEGRCIESVGLDGFARTTLAINKYAHMTQVTNSLDNVTTYLWNNQGQVVTEISALGNKRVTEYDALGRLARRIMPSGAATVYSYDERGDLCSLTEPTGAVTRFEHNDRHELVAVIDPAGFRWARSFDDRGRLAWVENPQGARTTYSYSGQGDPIERRSPLGYSFGYQWDALGNLSAVVDALGHATRYEYDEEGLLVALVDPGPEVGKPGPRTELYRDALGRVTMVRFPDGARRRFAYHPTEQMTQYVDEKGAVTRWRYLACGLLAEEIKPLGIRIQYHWGSEPGLLQSITNAAGEHYKFTHDVEGRLVSETDFGGRCTKYKYDHDGNVVAAINAIGQPTKFRRDGSGALTEATYHDGTQVKLVYDPRGLLLRADNPDAVVEREYDALGHLLCERITHDGTTREVRSEYDAVGHRVCRTSSLGYEVVFEWNPNDQLSALRPEGQEALRFDYAPDGSEVARYLGNGIRIEKRHDARGRVVEQLAGLRDPVTGRVAVGGAASVHRSYRYDPAGNLLEVQDALRGQTRYEYDINGRITSHVNAGRWSESFEYDPTDNIRSVSEYTSDPVDRTQPRRERVYSYRPGNQLERIGDTFYEYDALGRLIQKTDSEGTTHYEWNPQGMLTRAILPDGAVWHYSYDLFARRLAKRGPQGATQFIWDGDVVLHEVRLSNNSVTDVVHWEFEPGSFIPMGKIENREAYLCVNEINGAPKELLNRAGKAAWTSSPTVYGLDYSLSESQTSESQIDCPISFQGQWRDEETGFSFNRYRYYDPKTGSYISQDPIKLEGGSNLYSYVNNTIGQADPFGLTPQQPSTYKGKVDAAILASDMKPLNRGSTDQNTPEWNKAKKDLQDAVKNGEKFQVKVKSSTDAKAFLKAALGNMNRYKAHKQSKADGASKCAKGYEQHMKREDAPRDRPHIKYYINNTDGHIFYDVPQ